MGKRLDLREIIETRNQGYFKNAGFFKLKVLLPFLEKLLCIENVNMLLTRHEHEGAKRFLDNAFDELDISYAVSQRDRDRVPSEGRLLIVSNHPLGGVDGLLLLKLLLEVRKDVKIIVNGYLLAIDNLSSYFLPYTLDNAGIQRDEVIGIHEALQKEMAVIIFPAGEVSRLGWGGIRDRKWLKGLIYFAKKNNTPILPVFIHGRNSIFFYAVALVSNLLAMLLLPRELFHKKGKTFSITVGNYIPSAAFQSVIKDEKYLAKLVKKHVYTIGRNKPGIFFTEQTIRHPASPKVIRRELRASELLGELPDGKSIYLVNASSAPETIDEVGRLREVTFRRVGEGTGRKTDIDKFDKHYRHIILWDDAHLDIVGAYRVGFGSEILANQGQKGFYSSALFTYSETMNEILEESLELGRSFVQAKYWNTAALDYLWYGIGALLCRNPQVKYLFGPVSLSSAYPEEVMQMVVFFYRKWFPAGLQYAEAKNPVIISETRTKAMAELFSSFDYKADFKMLKKLMKIKGYAVPTLYKQYTEVAYDGGSTFSDFSVDPDFQNCVDGFILISVDMIKDEKKEKYIYRHLLQEAI